jgi:hypothetical protein
MTEFINFIFKDNTVRIISNLNKIKIPSIIDKILETNILKNEEKLVLREKRLSIESFCK